VTIRNITPLQQIPHAEQSRLATVVSVSMDIGFLIDV